MRKFKTGATRNEDFIKIDPEGFFNPLLIESFSEYMNKHRLQSDGKIRESDNWQRLFGDDHYKVCMKSTWRHFLHFWKIHRGYKVIEDGKEVTLEDACNGIIFNVWAYLFKYLLWEKKQKTS